MKTEYISMTEENIDRQGIERAGEILRAGGLVAFPTETVYGLGGDALNPESSKKIYAAKGRPSDNPLIVHICRLEDTEAIAEKIPETYYRLAKAFWPGPLTIILNKSSRVPVETTGGLGTVAIRFPSNRIAHALIEAEGGFIAAPSANRSGRPSPTLAKYCREDLDGRVEMIIDGGQVGIGVESTIVDLTEGRPVILRPGRITKEMLDAELGSVDVDRTILSADSGIRPKAPGMKYRHYAPKGDLKIVCGSRDNVVAYINEAAAAAHAAGGKTGVIAAEDTCAMYRADSVKCAGSRQDEETVARELFRILREFDDENCTVMFSEAFDDSGIGMAVMNRLTKAAGHQIVDADAYRQKENGGVGV
ncbi:MAG: threonylcarbamoyl-AMP synthase [Lachnospiraceae bacterium]|jgi:L-threonylcarbamoyladenylate synthase|nr:threonylcarbamoyl-AMP synthase [Lachnospiraceae bacterium]